MRENDEPTSTARGTRTMKQCSFDMRYKGQPDHSLTERWGESWKAIAWANGTSREIDCEAIGG